MKKLKSVTGLEYAVLFVVLIVLSFFVYRYVNYTLDSDASSELVLARLLADEGGILSANWCYSTELRVLNTQLIWTLLMVLGLSWHMVRVLGSIIMYFVILLCLWLMLKKAELSHCFPATAIFLLLPLSKEYFTIFLEFAYYIPHVAISFLTIGLLLGTLKVEGKKKIYLLMTLNFLLALAAGLGGLRQLLILYIPLVLSTAYMLWLSRGGEQNKSLLYQSLVLLLAAVAGYAVNALCLSKMYSFSANDSLCYAAFSFSGLETMINGMLNLFGYPADTEVFSVNFLLAALSVMLFAAAIFCSIYIIKKGEEYNQGALLLATFFVSCQLMLWLLYSMTDMTYLDRYLIPTTAFAYPVIVACLKNTKSFSGLAQAMCGLLLVLTLLCGGMNYNELRKTDDTKGQREAVAALTEQGYTQGYATFWNANVLTELSNGQLEMWQWSDGKQSIETLEDFNDIYPWLQVKTHLESAPQGKFFVLLSANEDYYFGFTKNFGDEYVVYRADNYYDYGYKDYIAYGFESYEQLAELLNK